MNNPQYLKAVDALEDVVTNGNRESANVAGYLLFREEDRVRSMKRKLQRLREKEVEVIGYSLLRLIQHHDYEYEIVHSGFIDAGQVEHVREMHSRCFFSESELWVNREDLVPDREWWREFDDLVRTGISFRINRRAKDLEEQLGRIEVRRNRLQEILIRFK